MVRFQGNDHRLDIYIHKNYKVYKVVTITYITCINNQYAWKILHGTNEMNKRDDQIV